MNVVRTIILDFDGLLVESNQEKMQAFEDLFVLYPEYQAAMMAYHLENYSLPRHLKFEYYVSELMGQPNTELLQTMSRQFSELVMRRVIACLEVPGTQSFLDEFFGQVPLYVSSVTPQDELQQIIQQRGLSSYFSAVFGDPPCRKSEAIQTVLAREKLLPVEVLFIGDSASDYRVATEAGLVFIGRDSGLSFAGIETEIYQDLYEIADVVRRRIKG